MTRRWEFDALRGLMLVLMTATHLPTQWSGPLGQPFGFVSAAEGFVLLSGFMAGMVYTRQAQRRGADEMRSAFLQRAAKVYVCQAALLAFLLTVVALLGAAFDQPAINDLVGFYRERPLAAIFSGFVLVYAPPLLDILPMYVLFLLASPVLLLHGLRQGWGLVLGLSIALWLGAQFGLGQALYEVLTNRLLRPVPYQQTGAFNTLAWQFLWVLGLWLGSQLAVGRPGGAPAEQPLVFPRWLLRTAWLVAVAGLLWRHGVGQVPFPALPGDAGANMMFSKWHLGPLRLMNLFALMVLLMHYAETLKRRLPRSSALESMGAASLPVFCAHLVLVLLVLAFAGAADPERPWAWDTALLVASLLALWGVAQLSAAAGRAGQRIRGASASRQSA